MLDIQSKITNAMLQLQMLLDEAGLDENEPVQDAFNALACALDEELVEE